MTVPTLTPPPTAPTREDPANFRTRADAFLGWFATGWSQLTEALTWIGDQITVASTKRDEAVAAATSAGNSATTASTKRDEVVAAAASADISATNAASSASAAAGSATSAGTSAAAAAASAATVNLPAISASKYLRANAAGNGWELRTAGQVKSDLGVSGSSGSGLQKGDGAGGFSEASSGIDYATPAMAGRHNQIINGAFQINQRGYASGSATTAGQYTFDRWKVTAAGGITYATTNNKTTVTIPSGQTLQQVVEGLSLQSGTYVLSWEGTSQGRIAGGSYGASGSVTASITGGINTTIEFNTGTVANVQLEPGTAATPFEFIPYQQTLAICQRYYERYGETSSFGANGYEASGTTPYQTFAYKVRKRVAPTVTKVGTMSVSNCGQPVVLFSERDGFATCVSVSSTGHYYWQGADSTTYFEISAEL